jgi:hypothetical protein
MSSPVTFSYDVMDDILFQVVCYTDISAYSGSSPQDISAYCDSLIADSFDVSTAGIIFDVDKLINNDIPNDSTDYPAGDLDDYEALGMCEEYEYD